MQKSYAKSKAKKDKYSIEYNGWKGSQGDGLKGVPSYKHLVQE